MIFRVIFKWSQKPLVWGNVTSSYDESKNRKQKKFVMDVIQQLCNTIFLNIDQAVII